jgi:hypothetical protein
MFPQVNPKREDLTRSDLGFYHLCVPKTYATRRYS